MENYITFNRYTLKGTYYCHKRHKHLDFQVKVVDSIHYQIILYGCSDKIIFDNFNIENVAKLAGVQLAVAGEIIFYKTIGDVSRILDALNMLHKMKYDDSRGVKFIEMKDDVHGKFVDLNSGEYKSFQVVHLDSSGSLPPYRLSLFNRGNKYFYDTIGMSVNEVASLANVDIVEDTMGFVYYKSIDDIKTILTVLNYLYYLKVVNRKPDTTPPYIYMPYIPVDNYDLCNTDANGKKIITSKYALVDTGIKYEGSLKGISFCCGNDVIENTKENIDFIKNKMYEISGVPKSFFSDNEHIKLDFE